MKKMLQKIYGVDKKHISVVNLEYKDFETDKEAAEYFKTRKEPSVLFCVRKNQDYSNIIWKRTKDKLKEKKTFSDDYNG